MQSPQFVLLPLLLLPSLCSCLGLPKLANFDDRLNASVQLNGATVDVVAYSWVKNDGLAAPRKPRWYTLGYPTLVNFSGSGNRTQDFVEFSPEISMWHVKLDLEPKVVKQALAEALRSRKNIAVQTDQICLLPVSSIICHLPGFTSAVPHMELLPFAVEFIPWNKTFFENVKNKSDNNMEMQLTCSIEYEHLNGVRNVTMYIPPRHATIVEDSLQVSQDQLQLQQLAANITSIDNRLQQLEAKLQGGSFGLAASPVNTSSLTSATISGRRFVVIQKRVSGSVNFHRKWTDYVNGFGDDTNWWIGLRTISDLTATSPRTLRVELTRFNGMQYHAEFLDFRVLGPETKFLMTYSKMDSSRSDFKGDALQTHKNMRFSTPDNDNDRSDVNCAELWNSGWWFNSCFEANPNGKYSTRASRAKNAIHWLFVDTRSREYMESFMTARLLLQVDE